VIARRALARGLGIKPASLSRADRRGIGPGTPIRVSKTHTAYMEDEVAAYLAARGLEWTGSDVRPIENEMADAGAPASTPEAVRSRHRDGGVA
jgi:hypothetical protein